VRRSRYFTIELILALSVSIPLFQPDTYAQTAYSLPNPQVGDTLIVDLNGDGSVEMLFPLHKHHPSWRGTSQVPDSLAILSSSGGLHLIFSYLPPGDNVAIGTIFIRDLDGNGAIDIVINYAADFLGTAQGQIDVFEVTGGPKQGWNFNLTLSTHPVSKLEEFDNQPGIEIIICQPWWSPGHPPYDSEPYVYPAAILKVDAEQGYYLANHAVANVIEQRISENSEVYQNTVAEFYQAPTRDLAESLIRKASEVVVWITALLDEVRLDQWCDEQTDLFHRMTPFADSLRTTDSDFQIYQNPVEALLDLKTRAHNRITWIRQTQGQTKRSSRLPH